LSKEWPDLDSFRLTFRSWTVAVRDNGIKIKSDKNEKLRSLNVRRRNSRE